MLKISKPLGSAKVTEYYRVDYTPADQRYYRDGQKQLVGEWHGQLSRTWGLIDGVDELHYARMADGKHPHTGEQLIKHRPPAETVSWIKSNTAWREHLESIVESALIEGKDPFRTVPESEWRLKAPKLESPPPIETTGKRSEREKKLLEMHRIASQTYIENLEGEGGPTARAYLELRHVSEESRREFGLGFADPSGAQLAQKLEHYGPELMEASIRRPQSCTRKAK